ncbi:MAG: PfkB family carbohydrate kinase [Gemmatimonadota bacterium]
MPRLGVVGTMVWDTIHARDVGRTEPVEEWGGIAYALSAFEAAAPEGWRLFPIIKVGADLAERAGSYLGRLRRIDSMDGVRPVPEPNNRVELVYHDAGRRCERLTGGVPGWSWEELAPLAASCDAMYVNFIAGWEMDLGCASELRRRFEGVMYGDIHSLMLGIGPDGVRRLRPLAAWREWLACFDLVQINEEELTTLAGPAGDPWRLAAEVVGEHTRALLVTLGERGAAWVAAAGFERLHGGLRRDGLAMRGGAVTGMVPIARPVTDGDPTGCGDVWGMTCFASLLGGRTLTEAMETANEFAVRNVGFRGASNLAELLRSEGRILGKEERSG